MYNSHASLHHPTLYKLLTCGLIALLADFFFYKEKIGWTAGLFCTVLLCAAFFLTPHSRWRIKCVLAILTFGQSLALIEHANSLSFLLAILGIVSTAISHDVRWQAHAGIWAGWMVHILLGFPKTLLRDHGLLARIRRRLSHRIKKQPWFINWILPFFCTGVFAALFSSANPVFGEWLNRFNKEWFVDLFDALRLLLIALTFAVSWSILRAKLKPSRKAVHTVMREGWMGWLFSDQAVFRSLVLFNLLFAMQTVTDMLYLWGGLTLPAHLTYAGYAHKGAYPLMVTALLAAAFVLIVFRNDRQEIPVATRLLLYGWIGQNVLLVASSILRLKLYVEEYSLTYLRLSAFIWMALIALGLLLILYRLCTRKSNLWLINANVIAALAVLYVSGFLPFGQIIAMYNVQHSYEVAGKGTRLDQYYIAGLGPQGIEAKLWFKRHSKMMDVPEQDAGNIDEWPIDILKLKQAQWRSWTFQNYRLEERLKTQYPSLIPEDALSSAH